MHPTHSTPQLPSQTQILSQPETAARARSLLHALLLAGMDPKPTSPISTTPSTPSSTMPTFPSPRANSLTTTTPPTAPPPAARQTLTIDTTTRITGHGNAITLSSPPTTTNGASGGVSAELILVALEKGCNVEIRSGVTVFGCRNVVAGAPVPAPTAGAGMGVGGKRKRGVGTDGGHVKRERGE